MNPRAKHGTTGYLLLLLTLLVPPFLKPALTPSMPSGSANEGQIFIQVEGDVNSPIISLEVFSCSQNRITQKGMARIK